MDIAMAGALLGVIYKVGLLIERLLVLQRRLQENEPVTVEDLRAELDEMRGEAQALVTVPGVGDGAARALKVIEEIDAELGKKPVAEALEWGLEMARYARQLYGKEADRLTGERREEMARRLGEKLLPRYTAKLAQLSVLIVVLGAFAGCGRTAGTKGRESIAPLPEAPGAYGLIYEFPAANADGVPIDSEDDVLIEVIEDSAGGQRVTVGTIWSAPRVETEVR